MSREHDTSTSQGQIKELLEYVRLAIEMKAEIAAAEPNEKNLQEYMNQFLTSFGYVEKAYNKYKKIREEELTDIEAQTEVQKSDGKANWNNIFVAESYQFRD